MRELNLDVAGEYLVMAATLTLIKSRLLLPSPEPEEDEEADPRADLVRQLLEYQRYREAAASLAERPLLRRDVFAREASADGRAARSRRQAARARDAVGADGGVPRRAGARAARSGAPGRGRAGLAARPHQRRAAHARRRPPVTFDSLFGEAPTRGFVIVTFLAVLELAKLGAIEAVQEEALRTDRHRAGGRGRAQRDHRPARRVRRDGGAGAAPAAG